MPETPMIAFNRSPTPNSELRTPPLTLTRGSQGVTTLSAPLQLSGASLWGLGRVINLEHPDVHCVLVDLDPDHRENAIAPLLDLMPATRIPPGPGEVEIQVRAAGLNFRDVLL